MPGIQSTNVTCTGGSSFPGLPHGDLECAERMAASRNVQFAMANYNAVSLTIEPRQGVYSPMHLRDRHQSSSYASQV